MNSVTKWAKHRKAGVQTVVGWLTLENLDNTEIFTDLCRREQKQIEEQKIDG